MTLRFKQSLTVSWAIRLKDCSTFHEAILMNEKAAPAAIPARRADFMLRVGSLGARVQQQARVVLRRPKRQDSKGANARSFVSFRA